MHFALVTLEHIIMLGQLLYLAWILGWTLILTLIAAQKTFTFICPHIFHNYMSSIHKYFCCKILTGNLYGLHVEIPFIPIYQSLCFYSGTVLGWGPLSTRTVMSKDRKWKDGYVKGWLYQRTKYSAPLSCHYL